MNKILIALIVSAFFLGACSSTKVATQPGAPPWQMMGNVNLTTVSVDVLLIDALKADLVENNTSKAINLLQRALKQDENNAALLFKLGELYYKAGRTSEAAYVLEKAILFAPGNKWNYILLADIYKSRQEYPNAIVTMEKLVKIVPQNPFYFQDIANLYLLTGNTQKALKTLDEMEQNFGVGPEITKAKIRIYLGLNKPEKAASEMEKLMEAFPGNTEYIRMLIDIYVAMKKNDKIAGLYAKILSIDPNDGKAQLIMADYYLRNGDTLQGHKFAREAFANTYLDMESKMKFLLLNYFQKEINENNVDIVLELSNILAKEYPENAQVFAFRGDVYYSMKEDDSALINYLTALRFEKNLVLLWQKVISIQFEQSAFTEAKQTALEALDYFPTSAINYLYLGLSENRLKENEDAAKHFLNGLDFCGDNEKLKLQFYFNLGETYNSLKEYANSDKYFDKLLALQPDDLLTLNNYAYYLSLRKEKLDKAEEMSKKTIDKEPENPAYLDTYGWILYLKGDFEQAVKYVEKALAKKKWDAEILEHLGDIYYKLNRNDEALKLWEKAKKKGSLSPWIDKKIADKKLYE